MPSINTDTFYKFLFFWNKYDVVYVYYKDAWWQSSPAVASMQFKHVMVVSTKLNVWTEQKVIHGGSSVQDIEPVACGWALALSAAEVCDIRQASGWAAVPSRLTFGRRRWRRHGYETGVERRPPSISLLEASTTCSSSNWQILLLICTYWRDHVMIILVLYVMFTSLPLRILLTYQHIV